jgi:3-hydroxyacyl-CoA dehydrogenase / enoyl-CoA hydratase / 3-hydroxybutyryl-CoA epimerase
LNDTITYTIDEQGIVTLTMDQPGQSTNTMNPVFRLALEAAVSRLEAEKDRVRGVILTSGKKTFFAGGDLNSLLATRPEDSEMMFERSMGHKSLMRRLETLGPPIVAAVNGTALGGGFELTLACHARFVLDDRRIALGLPEATLGLMPGAGGIVRMVRMLGVEAAASLILEGIIFDPQRGVELKLCNGLAKDKEELLGLARAWIGANQAPKQAWDVKGFRVPGSNGASAASLTYLRQAPLALIRKHRGLYPAPETALAALVECANVDFDTASKIESRYLVHLATHPVAKNLITTFFFQMNEIKGGKGRPEGVTAFSARRVGVLGAGQMGAGIAQVAAQKGITVVLKDIDDEKAAQGKRRVEDSLRRSVEKGFLSAESAKDSLERVRSTGKASDLDGCDLIIETVSESRQIKALATREAEPFLAPGGVFGSNTSTLPISGLASACARPENFIGIHFFSPVDRMALVEIIKGAKTSPETLAHAYDFVQQLGKTPIVVNDSRGFFTSRVFGTFTKEGAAMLGEGVPAAMIENAAHAIGMPVGPLAVMDETSMGLMWSMRQQTIADLQAEGADVPQHPGWPVIEKMVVMLKRSGRAGGGGFYDYPAEGKKALWTGLAQQFPGARQEPNYQDLRDRLLYIQAIESVRCMEEGVIESSRDANIGSVLGIGFPRWTGGTLQYINSVGLDAFVSRANELAGGYGQRFEPPALLVSMVQSGKRFE